MNEGIVRLPFEVVATDRDRLVCLPHVPQRHDEPVARCSVMRSEFPCRAKSVDLHLSVDAIREHHVGVVGSRIEADDRAKLFGCFLTLPLIT